MPDIKHNQLIQKRQVDDTISLDVTELIHELVTLLKEM